MRLSKKLLACAAAGHALAGCGGSGVGEPASNTAANTNASRAGATPAAAANAGAAETGVEKVKPAPGTGNVQGKVLYNGKPVEGIEAKLCEKFNQFLGGCTGKTYTAKSDAAGEYVITDVPPMTYEGLMVRVFDTDSYVFATTGLAGLSSAKYDVTDESEG